MEMQELEIKNFYSIVETKIELTEQVRKLHGKELAPDFNSFDFWWIDENKVSEIISFFLNPNGNHDQGDIYLKHFLKKFDLQFFTFDNSDEISVECEYRTDFDRRIDIVIIKNSFEQAIGIENKIHTTTKDQKNQLSDYSDFLNNKTDGNYCLIYLSPKDKNISEDSIKQENKVKLENSHKLITLTYEDDIIQCIAEFSLLTTNVRVKAFLNDLEKKLKYMYMGEKNLDTKRIVANYINENEKNLKVSFIIANSLQEVKKDLMQKVALQIEEVGKELGLEVMGNMKLKPTNWNNNYIRFNFEGGGLLYGLGRNNLDKDKHRFAEIDNLLEKELNNKFKVSEWWSMWQFLYQNIENNENLWIEIQNGQLKGKVFEFVKLINDKFNNEKY